MTIVRIQKSDPSYPAPMREHMGDHAPDAIWMMGNLDLFRQKAIALFCSVKCPGNLILQTYDLVKQWREAGITVIGGFHSPMEQECLNILLKGKQPVIICPARSIEGMRLRGEYKQPLADGRLLMLSPFEEKIGRTTGDTASTRNELVAALADTVFVVYAAPSSKTEALCRKVHAWGKPLYTFGDKANANLLKLGAQPFDPYSIHL